MRLSTAAAIVRCVWVLTDRRSIYVCRYPARFLAPESFLSILINSNRSTRSRCGRRICEAINENWLVLNVLVPPRMVFFGSHMMVIHDYAGRSHSALSDFINIWLNLLLSVNVLTEHCFVVVVVVRVIVSSCDMSSWGYSRTSCQFGRIPVFWSVHVCFALFYYFAISWPFVWLINNALNLAGRPHGCTVSYVSALIHKTHAMITTASSRQSERKKALVFASVATSVSGDDNCDDDEEEGTVHLSLQCRTLGRRTRLRI